MGNSYFIKMILVSGILYLYYHFTLRNKKFHTYNRYYLLFAVAASIILPYMNITWYEIKNPSTIPILILLPAKGHIQYPLPTIRANWILLGGIISFILLIFVFVKVAWVFKVKREGIKTQMQGFTFIDTPVRQAPFSFLNNLFWKTGMDINTAPGIKIFRHEMVHIKQKHTYDKLFVQIVSCLFWINPFYWLIQKELTAIHEFIADESCIEKGDTASFASMLLLSYNEGRYLDPSHTFFHSSIKRRLIMITTQRTSAGSYLRRILALPILASVLFLLFIKTASGQQTGSTHPDPKLHVGEEVKVTKVTLLKKANINTKDSTADVTINYISSDGKPGLLHLTNVGYSETDSTKQPHIKLEDGTEVSISVVEVKDWTKRIIQDPPNVVYYLNGVETTKDKIKMLDINKITTANMMHGDEAVAKYGEKARNGIILFTTTN